MNSNQPNKIRHYVRVRPTGNFDHKNLNFAEKRSKARPNEKKISIVVKKLKKNGLDHSHYGFTVDDIFYNSDQEQVYNTTFSTHVQNSINGKSGAIITYGEEKSGKTFTLSGPKDKRHFKQRGIVPRALGELFALKKTHPTKDINISISYAEISDSYIRDLITPQNSISKIFDDENFPKFTKIQNLTELTVSTESEALKSFFLSERSKRQENCSIFTVQVTTQDSTISGGDNTKALIKFVDLSSWGKSNNEHTSAGLNQKSLSFLEQAFLLLHQNKPVPWRSCLLTHALKGAFTNNTVLISTIHGEKRHLQGTVQTLKFANRINMFNTEEFSFEKTSFDARIQDLQKEIEKLKTELKMRNIFDGKSDVFVKTGNFDQHTDVELATLEDNVNDFLKGEIKNLDINTNRDLKATLQIFKNIYLKQSDNVENELRQKYQFTSREKLSDRKPSVTAKLDQKSQISEKKSVKTKKTTKKNDSSKTSVMASSLNVSSVNSSTPEARNQMLKKDEDCQVDTEQKFNDFKIGQKEYNEILRIKKELVKSQRMIKLQADRVNETVDVINLYEDRKPTSKILTEEELLIAKKLAKYQHEYISQKKELRNLMFEEETLKEEMISLRTKLIGLFQQQYPNENLSLLPLTTSTAALPRHPPFKI